MILILQHPVTSLTALRQPNSMTLVSIQTAVGWQAVPPRARTLDRVIWITPISDRTSRLEVVLATGARSGFELVLPHAP